LVGLCNTPFSVKICVIDSKAFLRYLDKAIAIEFHPFGHEPLDRLCGK
jgi:hypothetical protein